MSYVPACVTTILKPCPSIRFVLCRLLLFKDGTTLENYIMNQEHRESLSQGTSCLNICLPCLRIDMVSIKMTRQILLVG